MTGRKRLLDEGDIAAARLLLLHLAERGDGEAAYDLARTFDREMLDRAWRQGHGRRSRQRARLVRAGLAGRQRQSGTNV